MDKCFHCGEPEFNHHYRTGCCPLQRADGTPSPVRGWAGTRFQPINPETDHGEVMIEAAKDLHKIAADLQELHPVIADRCRRVINKLTGQEAATNA